MKNFTNLNNRMKELGEEIAYTTMERQRLQSVFTDGKLNSGICWAGWVKYTDNKGEIHYTKSFSNDVENMMEQLCLERIRYVEQEMKALYETFNLEQCVNYINKYIKEISEMEADSYEWQRLIKNASTSLAEVEHGKLNKEIGKSYDYIVIRQRGYYAASIRIAKNENGYRIEKRYPLCGECSCQTDIYGLFKYLKEFTRNAIY